MSVANLPLLLVAVLSAYLVGRLVRQRFAAALAGGAAAVTIPLAVLGTLWAVSAGDGDTVPSDDPWWSTAILVALFVGLPLFTFGAAFGWLGAGTRRSRE